jgi:hypothetical protein
MFEEHLRVMMKEKSEMDVALTEYIMDYQEKLKMEYAEKFQDLEIEYENMFKNLSKSK